MFLSDRAAQRLALPAGGGERGFALETEKTPSHEKAQKCGAYPKPATRGVGWLFIYLRRFRQSDYDCQAVSFLSTALTEHFLALH